MSDAKIPDDVVDVLVRVLEDLRNLRPYVMAAGEQYVIASLYDEVSEVVRKYKLKRLAR